MALQTSLAMRMMDAMERSDKASVKTLFVTSKLSKMLQKEADAMRSPEELKEKAYSSAYLTRKKRKALLEMISAEKCKGRPSKPEAEKRARALERLQRKHGEA